MINDIWTKWINNIHMDFQNVLLICLARTAQANAYVTLLTQRDVTKSMDRAAASLGGRGRIVPQM